MAFASELRARLKPALVVPWLLLVGCEALFDIDEKRLTSAPPPPPPQSATPAPTFPTTAPFDAAAPAPTHGARPPPRPIGQSSGLASAVAFGASAMYLGAIDPDTDVPDPNAWRRIGYDIDGVDTTAALAASSRGPGTCRRAEDADIDALVDGYEGRDNNFGSQVLKVAAAVSSGPESLERGASQSMWLGLPTFVIVISDLNDGPDDPEVTVGVYMSTPSRPPQPLWEDGTYRFSLDSRTVVPGSLTPKTQFKRAYMTNHTVVSGDFNAAAEAPLLMPLDPSNGITVLTPLAMTLAVELDPTHKRALSATFSLVLTLNDVVSLLAPVALRFGVISCGPQGRATLFGIVQRFADLRTDRPSFLDPTGTTDCDAMSYAFRLRLIPARLPVIGDVTVAAPASGPCDSP